MPLKAAFLFIAPDCDPAQHRAVIDSPAVQLSVVGVKNYADAQQAAARLVQDGVAAIELCAGFGSEGVALVAQAAGDRAIVGAVRFALHPAFQHQSGDKLFK